MDSDLDTLISDTPSSSTTSSTPFLVLARSAWPSASSLATSRYILRRKGHIYTAGPKIAHKRGIMSFIWDHGTEFRRKGLPKPDWLCNYCWDKRTIIIENTSITHRCIKHLEEVHRLNEHDPIADLEDITPTILDL